MGDKATDFKAKLKEKGYKLTSQRQAILDAIIQSNGKHLNAEEIYSLVKVEHPEIGLATVYRTVLLFDKMGLVYKIDLDDGCSRYELNKHNEDHRHHHLICTRCGMVSEMEEDLLDSIEEKILKKNSFLVNDHRVKFYGYCNECNKRKF